MKTLVDVAKVVRSKNCSPFELTLDIIFKTKEVYDAVKKGNLIDKSTIARLYHTSPEVIRDVIYFDPSHAVKITMKRTIPSGSPGDTDVYGAQQHAPLLDLEFNLD